MTDIVTKLRQPRTIVLGTEVAILDLGLTLLVTYYVARQAGVEYPLIWSPVLGVAGGYAVHKLLGIDTPLTNRIDSAVEGKKVEDKPTEPSDIPILPPPSSSVTNITQSPPSKQPQFEPLPISPVSGGVIFPTGGLTQSSSSPDRVLGWGMRGGTPSADLPALGRPYWVDLAEQVGINTEEVLPFLGELVMGLL